MAIPPLPVDAASAGDFSFLRVTPRYADRDRTQQATTSEGVPRWRVELLLVPNDEGSRAEILRVGFSGSRPEFDRNEPVIPVGLTVGEFQGSVYLTVEDLRRADDVAPIIGRSNLFGATKDDE